MNKLIKSLLAVLIGAVLSMSLAGCGKSEKPKEQPTQQQPAQEHPSSEHPSSEHPSAEHPK